MSPNNTDPHADQPVVTAGVDLDECHFAVILLHGRGADPSGMLQLAAQLQAPHAAFLVPSASQNRWYPRGFLEPIDANEPDLSSALDVVTRLVQQCKDAGLSPQHVVLGGFSQGACLASEWVARNPARYGGLLVLSGGLIGPLGELPEHAGSLDGTPVYVGCSDVDPWIPIRRVRETVAELSRMGGIVEEDLFVGADHSVRPREIERANALLATLEMRR